jgi:hypothetical protein
MTTRWKPLAANSYGAVTLVDIKNMVSTGCTSGVVAGMLFNTTEKKSYRGMLAFHHPFSYIFAVHGMHVGDQIHSCKSPIDSAHSQVLRNSIFESILGSESFTHTSVGRRLQTHVLCHDFAKEPGRSSSFKKTGNLCEGRGLY